MLKIADSHNKRLTVEFIDKYNFICEYSASGKTYLRNLLRDYCIINNIQYIEIYQPTNIDNEINLMLNVDINRESVLFIDNAEVIVTRDLEFAMYKSKAKTKIIVSHDIEPIPHLQFVMAGVYALFLNNGMLCTRRIGQL